MIQSLAESDAPVQEEGEERCYDNWQSFGYQRIDIQYANTEIQNQAIECQSDQLN